MSPNGLNLLYGGDAVTLGLVVPATLSARWFWHRCHRMAAPMALGTALYALYFAGGDVLIPNYSQCTGNNEQFFMLLFLVPISVSTGVGLWRGHATAIKAAFGIASFLTLQLTAVLAMGAVMLWWHDPTPSPALVYIRTRIFQLLAALTVVLLDSYTGGAPRAKRGCVPDVARAWCGIERSHLPGATEEREGADQRWPLHKSPGLPRAQPAHPRVIARPRAWLRTTGATGTTCARGL